MPQGCIQSLEITDIFAVKKDVYIWAQFACFITQAEAQSRVIMVKRSDYFTHCMSRNFDRWLIARFFTQRVWQYHQRMWNSRRYIHIKPSIVNQLYLPR